MPRRPPARFDASSCTSQLGSLPRPDGSFCTCRPAGPGRPPGRTVHPRLRTTRGQHDLTPATRPYPEKENPDEQVGYSTASQTDDPRLTPNDLSSTRSSVDRGLIVTGERGPGAESRTSPSRCGGARFRGGDRRPVVAGCRRLVGRVSDLERVNLSKPAPAACKSLLTLSRKVLEQAAEAGRSPRTRAAEDPPRS